MSNLESIASAEQALIGAIIRDNALLDSLRVSPEHLTTFHAKTVLASAETLRASGTPFDEIVLFGSLETKSIGMDYLTQATISGLPAFASEYETAILAFQRKKQFLELMDEAKRMCAQYGVEHAMGEVLEQINRIDTGRKNTSINIATAVTSLLKEIEQNADKPRGLPMGVGRLTNITGGFRPGVVSIVAARPGMGKSSFGLAIAKANAAAGHGVHVFTLEDSADMYSARYIASTAELPTDRLYSMQVSREQMSRVALLKAQWRTSKPYWEIDESNPERPDELVRRVRAMSASNNTKIVIVDYLQIVASSIDGARNEHEAITKCMHVFQQAAKRDNMAYVVMCQLNRNLESRDDKRPQLSDMRASGSIEERAKLVLGLYRGAYYHEKPIEGIDYPKDKLAPNDEEFREQIKICVLKNSSGPTGEVTANWRGEFCEIT